MGKLPPLCRVGMLQRAVFDLQHPRQLDALQTSTHDARDWAMDHIHNLAALHWIDKYWTTGAKKGPPKVHDVPKNESDDLKNWRVTPQPFYPLLLLGHLWKVAVWPFLDDIVAFWSLRVTNMYTLTWATPHIVHTTRFEPLDGAYIASSAVCT